MQLSDTEIWSIFCRRSPYSFYKLKQYYEVIAVVYLLLKLSGDINKASSSSEFLRFYIVSEFQKFTGTVIYNLIL